DGGVVGHPHVVVVVRLPGSYGLDDEAFVAQIDGGLAVAVDDLDAVVEHPQVAGLVRPAEGGHAGEEQVGEALDVHVELDDRALVLHPLGGGQVVVGVGVAVAGGQEDAGDGEDDVARRVAAAAAAAAGDHVVGEPGG